MCLKLTSIIVVLTAFGIIAEEVKWPAPPSGFSSRKNDSPHGKVSAYSYTATQFNNENKPVKVYTPPNYSATATTKYPVLYLLHGIGGNESAWTSSEGNADNVLDNLYKDNKAVPMIVVMPHGGAFGTDMFDKFAKFENVLIKDLIPYIEKNFNASPDSNMRAIAGLSMGGGQTLNFGYKYPKVFTWIGAFSPAPNTTAAGTTITDMASVKANIHLNYLAAGTGSGDADYLSRARTYHNYLNQNGVKNLYLQSEQGLNHEPENWNRQLYNFAQRVFQGITPVSHSESLKMVPIAKSTNGTQKLLISNNRAGSKPWGLFVSQTGNTSSKVFSLTGRTAASTSRNFDFSTPVNHQ